MFTKILVPTDGSALSERAALAAVALAQKVGAEVVGLTVIPPFHTLTLKPSQVEESAANFNAAKQADAERYLAVIAGAAHQANVQCLTESVVADDAAHAIIDCARRHLCDVVAMGSHGRTGIRAALLGSVTQKVLVDSAIPVLVYR